MAANDYIGGLDGRMLLRMGGLACGPLVLAVSTLVAMGPDADIASMAPTLPGVGLATATDEDTNGYAEAGGSASSHQPFPTPLGCYNTGCIVNINYSLFQLSELFTYLNTPPPKGFGQVRIHCTLIVSAVH